MKDFEVHNGIRYKLEKRLMFHKDGSKEKKILYVGVLNFYENLTVLDLTIQEMKSLRFILDKLLEEHEKVCKN